MITFKPMITVMGGCIPGFLDECDVLGPIPDYAEIFQLAAARA